MAISSHPEPRHPEAGGRAQEAGRSWWGSRRRPTIWRPRPGARCGRSTWTSLWPMTSTGQDSGFQVDTNEVTLIPPGRRAGAPAAAEQGGGGGEDPGPGGRSSWRPGTGRAERCLKTRCWNCGNWWTACRIGSAINGAWAGGGCRGRSKPRRQVPGATGRKIPTLEEIRAEMGRLPPLQALRRPHQPGLRGRARRAPG